jgi:hypothetical protein
MDWFQKCVAAFPFLVAQAQVQSFHTEFILRHGKVAGDICPRALAIVGTRLQNIPGPNERFDTQRR